MALYNGLYNMSGQVLSLWTHADKKSHAHRNFISQLSEKLGRTKSSLRLYFIGDKDNVKIIKQEDEN